MRQRPAAMIFGLLWLTAAAVAQDKCSAEIKLLLEPSDVSSAVKALGAGTPVEASVYFYDTTARELFSRGAIVRARKGSAVADLIVKIRVSKDAEIPVRDLGPNYKCEIDRTGETAVRSYSVRSKLNGGPPTTGEDLWKRLSHAQKRFLEQQHLSPDWTRVEVAASINSTVWRVPDQAGLTKLTLELWQWGANRVLELSTKAANDNPSLEMQLKKLVSDKGISIAIRDPPAVN